MLLTFTAFLSGIGSVKMSIDMFIFDYIMFKFAFRISFEVLLKSFAWIYLVLFVISCISDYSTISSPFSNSNFFYFNFVLILSVIFSFIDLSNVFFLSFYNILRSTSITIYYWTDFCIRFYIFSSLFILFF